MGNGATALIAARARKGLKEISLCEVGGGEGREARGHLSARNLKALCKARNSPLYG